MTGTVDAMAGVEAPRNAGIQLIREYKTPTVDELIRRADDEEVWLPGQMEAVEEAIQKGDLPAAGAILAMGLGGNSAPESGWRRVGAAGWWRLGAGAAVIALVLWWIVSASTV